MSSGSSNTPQLNPPLKPLRHSSTSLSNITYQNINLKQTLRPLKLYLHIDIILGPLPNRRLSDTDSSTLIFSALSSNSALRFLRQHAQPVSSDSTHPSELVPQSYFTSGVDTASLLSSDVQTSYLSGNLFSEVLVPPPVAPHVRIPEYFTTDHSRPPTFCSDYPIRVDGNTIYDPQNDPRFHILTERFITTDNSLSNKRKETELKRPQTPNLELKFEVRVKFQGLNPLPIFYVSKIDYKTTPAPFEGILVDFNRDVEFNTLAYGKMSFTTLILASNILLPFNKHTSTSLTYILLYYITISFT